MGIVSIMELRLKKKRNFKNINKKKKSVVEELPTQVLLSILFVKLQYNHHFLQRLRKCL